MTWLIVISIVAVIGGIIGFFSSNDGERGAGAASGAAAGALGCGYLIFQLFLAALSFGLLFALIGWLFD